MLLSHIRNTDVPNSGGDAELLVCASTTYQRYLPYCATGMTWLIQDVRFGLRSITKDRAFFLTTVLALALGIGAVTVIFTVIDSIVLNPFPYFDSQRIYEIEIRDRTTNATAIRNWFSVPEFLDIQEHNQVFDRSLGVWEESTLLGDPSSPESLDTDLVTGNAFQMLGVPA